MKLPLTIEMARARFSPLEQHPCWNVKQGHGSFLTFEFGMPSLKVLEPKPGMRRKRRIVDTRGEWHLWIYQCHWLIFASPNVPQLGEHTLQSRLLLDDPLATSESDEWSIREACRSLSGQCLASLEIEPSTARTRFTWEYGEVLETARYEDVVDGIQWYLYQPDGQVLTLLWSGQLMEGPGNEP